VKTLRVLLVVGGYIAALLWAYSTLVSPHFAYDGYKLAWPDAKSMVWLTTLSLVPALFMPYALSKPSAMILWWLYIAAYIPSIFIPALSLTMPFEQLVPLQLCLLLCMGFLRFTSTARLLAIGRIELSPALFWSVFWIAWSACIAFICMHFRADILLANVASLFTGGSEYAIRSAFVVELSHAGRILGYVTGQVSQALDPYLIAFGIVHRRRACLVAGILGQLLVFSVTGLKIILFSSVFLAGLFLIMRRWQHWRRSFGLILTTGVTAMILLSAVADMTTKGVIFSSLITRRTLAAPGLLTGFYFEHFSHVSHAGVGFRFSQNSGPYFGPPQEIGLAYFGSADVDANANFWAEGFADFGMAGIVGFTLLVAFMVWIYDSIFAVHSLELGALMTAMPALNLSNTAPTTVLLTHGALATALLLYLTPWKSREAAEPEAQTEETASEFSPALSG
jgi:hypothetical protein